MHRSRMATSQATRRRCWGCCGTTSGECRGHQPTCMIAPGLALPAKAHAQHTQSPGTRNQIWWELRIPATSSRWRPPCPRGARGPRCQLPAHCAACGNESPTPAACALGASPCTPLSRTPSPVPRPQGPGHQQQPQPQIVPPPDRPGVPPDAACVGPAVPPRARAGGPAGAGRARPRRRGRGGRGRRRGWGRGGGGGRRGGGSAGR